MSDVERIADRLLREHIGYVPGPYRWLNEPPRVADLWPCDQDAYRRMAHIILREQAKP